MSHSLSEIYFEQDSVYLPASVNPELNKVPWRGLWFHGTSVSSDACPEKLGFSLSQVYIHSAK